MCTQLILHTGRVKVSAGVPEPPEASVGHQAVREGHADGHRKAVGERGDGIAGAGSVLLRNECP